MRESRDAFRESRAYGCASYLIGGKNESGPDGADNTDPAPNQAVVEATNMARFPYSTSVLGCHAPFSQEAHCG